MEPAVPTDSPEVNALLDQGRVPTPVKAAGIALAGAAVLVTLTGLQTAVIIRWEGLQILLPLLLLGAGIGSGLVASSLVKGRAWTLLWGLVASSAMTVTTFAFFVVGLMSGLVTLLGFLGLGGAAASVVLVALAVGPFKKLIEVRKKLRAAGYDLDF